MMVIFSDRLFALWFACYGIYGKSMSGAHYKTLSSHSSCPSMVAVTCEVESSRKNQKNQSSPGHYNWYAPIPCVCLKKKNALLSREILKTNGYRDTKRDSRVSSTFSKHKLIIILLASRRSTQLFSFKRRTREVLRRRSRRQSSSSATCRLWLFLRQRGWQSRAPSSSSTLARGCRPWSLRRRRPRAWRGSPRIESERCP